MKRRCSCCGKPGRIHDKLPTRPWRFVPLWNIPVILHYAPRRVVCPDTSKPTVEAMLWNRGKSPYAEPYMIFLTLVCQIDRSSRRLIWIGRARTEATLREGFDELEKLHTGFLAGLQVVCSDMWKPFLKVIRQRSSQALNVLDPFHVAKHRVLGNSRRASVASGSTAARPGPQPISVSGRQEPCDRASLQ